jgi:uncharacterized protein (DUF433 family)
MTWQPHTGETALTESEEGMLLTVDGESFGPTGDWDGLGAICFALGLDNSPMFHTANCPPFSNRWAVWHFSSVLSRSALDADMPQVIERGLQAARKLMDVERFSEIDELFSQRLALVVQHHSMRAEELHAGGEPESIPNPTPVEPLRVQPDHPPRVVVDPEIMGGTPCLAGSRLPAATLLAMVDGGGGWERIVSSWPWVTEAHVQAARGWAAAQPTVYAEISPPRLNLARARQMLERKKKD